MIDMIPAKTAAGEEGFVPHCGGAVFNTAIALGRLGARTSMLTGLSTDMFGQQLADFLKASHVDMGHVIFANRPTTLAFVRLVGGHATYEFFDENSAGRMIAPQDMPDLLAEVSALFFGGISLACEPAADAYAALLQNNADGRVVMLDPNIRPGFVQDIARYRARLTKMIGLANILKVSDEDLNWITPEPLSLHDKVARLLWQGPSVVILTRGGDGTTGYLARGGEVHVPALKSEIADTVGAGDTFNAGVLAKLSELGALHTEGLANLDADTLKAALLQGARVAAITVSRAGANPPWAGEL